MRLLLDTHTFVWWEAEAKQLSSTALSAIMTPENTIYLSMVSIWEMQIKTQLGKMTLTESLADKINRQQNQNQIQLLSILPQHIYHLAQLPDHHRDPFDRLLIAQAQLEQMPLITTDKAIQAYDVETLW